MRMINISNSKIYTIAGASPLPFSFNMNSVFCIYMISYLLTIYRTGNGINQFSGDGGPGYLASLNNPHYIAVDAAYNVFVTDTSNHRIRVIMSINGNISTIAGTGEVKLDSRD